MSDDYRLILKRRELFYTLKTGVKFKRKNFHRIIAYLSRQGKNYVFSKSEVEGEGVISFFHLRSEDKDLQISHLSDTFAKYVPESSLLKVEDQNKYEFVVNFFYDRKKIDWAGIDIELLNNHKDNIFLHGTMQIPLISNHFVEWWNN